MEAPDFFHEKLGKQIISGMENLQFMHAHILQTSELKATNRF